MKKRSNGNLIEYRQLRAAELRMDEDPKTHAPVLTGYAARFNSFSEELTEESGLPFREIIRPGTFTRTLANNCDARLLINHEGLPLARTASGTLTLREDAQGLLVRAPLEPSDPDVQRLLPKFKRGDLNEMSFAFTTVKDHLRTENGRDIRELHDVDLHDVSIVTNPAYQAATCSLRSLQEYRKNRALSEKDLDNDNDNDTDGSGEMDKDSLRSNNTVHEATHSRAAGLIKEGKISDGTWDAPNKTDRKQEDCLGSDLSYPIIKGGMVFLAALRSAASRGAQNCPPVGKAASALLELANEKGKNSLPSLSIARAKLMIAERRCLLV